MDIFLSDYNFIFSVRIRKVVAKGDCWDVRFEFLTAVDERVILGCNSVKYRESSPLYVLQKRRALFRQHNTVGPALLINSLKPSG
jgi:hypothetical protein